MTAGEWFSYLTDQVLSGVSTALFIAGACGIAAVIYALYRAYQEASDGGSPTRFYVAALIAGFLTIPALIAGFLSNIFTG